MRAHIEEYEGTYRDIQRSMRAHIEEYEGTYRGVCGHI